MDQLKARQDLYNGFGVSFARAFEFVMTPVLFGAIGYLLDRIFGTLPVFTIILTVFCFVGVGVKMYYGYQADMASIEKDAPWAKERSADDKSRSRP